MDFIWLMIILAIVSNVVKANKEKKKAAQEARTADFGRGFAPGTAAQKAAPKPAAKPVQKPSAAMLTQTERPKVAQPRVETTVHTHVAPACDEHDKSGSMDFRSGEGVDPCHETQLPPMAQPRPTVPSPEEEQPGLQLEWTGENMVKAFIMQEVLTRPCDRRRRA